jgi:hypothetical protein
MSPSAPSAISTASANVASLPAGKPSQGSRHSMSLAPRRMRRFQGACWHCGAGTQPCRQGPRGFTGPDARGCTPCHFRPNNRVRAGWQREHRCVRSLHANHPARPTVRSSSMDSCRRRFRFVGARRAGEGSPRGRHRGRRFMGDRRTQVAEFSLEPVSKPRTALGGTRWLFPRPRAFDSSNQLTIMWSYLRTLRQLGVF